MASLIERERTYQTVVYCQRRRYKVPGFDRNAIGKGLSQELGRNIGKLLACKASGAIPPDLRQYVETLPVHIRRSMAAQGIIEPVVEGKPLVEHLADYRAAMEAKGASAGHVKATCGMIRDAAAWCKLKMLGDMTPAKLREFLADRRADKPELDAEGKPVKGADGKPNMRRGISARQHNATIIAWGGFFRWCIRERRCYENPIVHVPKLNEKTDRRHERRALTTGEVRALLTGTEGGAELYGISGVERALVYRVAVETGLRMNELATLTRGCVDLAALTLTVKAGYSKHRREDVLPMRPELAEALKKHVEHKAPAARVFLMPHRFDVLDAFYADLAAARIDRRDESGRVVDFHALRHTFISSLAAAGVHPKTAQTLARHSTISLTMDRYTHTLRGAEASALASLPNYGTPEAASVKRTGTDDVPVNPTDRTPQNGQNPPLRLAGENQSGTEAENTPEKIRGEIRARAGSKTVPL